MITDNELLLYYYRDGLDAADRQRIAKALSDDAELAARLHRLVARLDAVAMTPDVPVPAHVEERWQAALSRAAAEEETAGDEPRSEGFARFRWQLIAAAVIGLAAIVSVRVAMHSAPEGLTEEGSNGQVAANVEASESSAYQRGLRVHLASTERQLEELDTASDDERAKLIETIIAQNRLYAVAAERANEPQLARVLRAFTPVLERLADESGDEKADDLAQLTFEMNVMQARLAAATANKPRAQSPAL